MSSSGDTFDNDTTQLTSYELRSTTQSIRNMYLEGKNIHDIRETYRSFCIKYPKLVDKLVEPNMNQEQLNYILKMFDSVQNQHTSLENASKKIGKDIFEKYVAPDLTPEQLARVKEKMSVLEDQSPEELALAASQLAHQQVKQSVNCPPSTTTTNLKRKRKLRKRPQ